MTSNNEFSHQQHQSTKKLNFIHQFNREKSYVKIDMRKHRIKVSPDEILNLCHLTQSEAAKTLGISVTTLKRRFHELNRGKWKNPKNEPLHPSVSPVTHPSPSVSVTPPQTTHGACFFRKRITLRELLNAEAQDEKYIDPQTRRTLASAFKAVESPSLKE